MSKRYYFIDKEIYFKNAKMPDRKVELFNVFIGDNMASGRDSEYNFYQIKKEDLIVEENKE